MMFVAVHSERRLSDKAVKCEKEESHVVESVIVTLDLIQNLTEILGVLGRFYELKVRRTPQISTALKKIRSRDR